MVLFKRTFLLFILITILSVPFGVSAISLWTGDDVNVSSDTKLSERNVYILGGRSSVDTEVSGDLSLLSGQTYISGTIEEDVVAGAGQLEFDANVKGDVRLVGGDVKVKGTVDGHTVIVGGEVTIEESADLKDEILVAAGRITINGEINPKIKIVSGHVTINGKLVGPSEITTQQLILNEDAEILGDISYFAPEEAYLKDGAVINGEVRFNQIQAIQDSNLFKSVVLNFLNFWILLQFVTTLLLAFILVYVFKVSTQKLADYALNSFFKSFLLGLASIILIPVLSAILFVSLIAMPISFLAMIMLTVFFILSSAVAGIVLGALVKKVIHKEEVTLISFQNATIGVILMTVLDFVPVVGDITRAIFIIIAIGTMAHYVYAKIRFRKVSNI